MTDNAGIISSSSTNPQKFSLDFYSEFDETHGRKSRKEWYNHATAAYVAARPRYPDDLVDACLQCAGLLKEKEETNQAAPSILELGCGPGTATVSLAQRGFRITALDPAPRNCAAARQQCETWKGSVQVLELTFEQYCAEQRQQEHLTGVDAIICPNSYHWLSHETRVANLAFLLRPGAPLLLWWALPPMPSPELCGELQDCYDALDLSDLGREIRNYGRREYCEPKFGSFTQGVTDGDLFESIDGDSRLKLEGRTFRYTPERFVLLLSTLSPYIALPQEKRNQLFETLTETLRELVQKQGQGDFEVHNFYGMSIFRRTRKKNWTVSKVI